MMTTETGTLLHQWFIMLKLNILESYNHSIVKVGRDLQGLQVQPQPIPTMTTKPTGLEARNQGVGSAFPQVL